MRHISRACRFTTGRISAPHLHASPRCGRPITRRAPPRGRPRPCTSCARPRSTSSMKQPILYSCVRPCPISIKRSAACDRSVPTRTRPPLASSLAGSSQRSLASHLCRLPPPMGTRAHLVVPLLLRRPPSSTNPPEEEVTALKALTRRAGMSARTGV